MGQVLEQERKIDEYVNFLKKRKHKNSSLPYLKYEKVLIEVEGWQTTAIQLLEAQYESKFYTSFTKSKIRALRDYIETLHAERFINCLTNKYVIDNFQSLNITSQCQQQTRVHYVSMRQTIMTLFSEYLEEHKINISLKKQDRCKILIIEKEVLQDDHIIMLAAKWFSEDFYYSYVNKVITEETMSQIQNQFLFFTRFQQELIKRIYDCTENSDVVYRTIFKDQRIYSIIMDAVHALHQDEILAFGKSIRLKQYVTLVELEASHEVQLCGDKGGFKLVIEQLKKICESQCPVKKFELIGQVKQKITESLDQYYQSDPNHKQIQIDADNFLIIIIFSLIKYNYGSFLAHIKFVNMVMGKQIEIERDDQSWVYVSFLAAINHILLYQQNDKNIRQSLTLHLKDVLASQKFY